MRPVVFAALSLVAVGFAGCAKAPAAPPGPDVAKAREAVMADARDIVAAMNAHDPDKVVSHDEPGIVGMMAGYPNFTGRDHDREAARQQVADPAMKMTVSDETVDMAASADLAVYRSTYAYTSTDPKTKKLGVEHGNWLLGYRRQPDGSWKVAWTVISNTSPPII
jgi:ketosteroid isomerase-like protein